MNKVNKINNFEYDNNNIYNDMDVTNQNNNNNEEQEIENNNEEEEDKDDRLTYTLITLNLGNLIHIFEENNISFIDMLLLTTEDLKELQLSLYQRNRIYNFSLLFNKYAKNYSISEISDFFSFNKQFIFNSSIYDRVMMTSYDQNENENENYINDENNLDNNNNYDNKFENRNININNKYNSKTNQQTYYNGGINNNYDNNINNISNIKNKKKNNISNSNINYSNKNNNSGNTLQNNNININQKNSTNNNLNYNNFENNKKKQSKTIINNNPNYKKETYKKYFNINNSSTLNNYLSIKKDTDDFLTKLNIQKEQSNNKRKEIYKLINNQKKISQFKKLDKGKNMIINNNDNILEKNIDNNERYKKMLDKIGKIEQMKIDYNSYNHLNQIKKYINSKGNNISIEDINKVNDEIDKMIEILNEKVKLRKALENCNIKINQKKKMINNIDKIEELSSDNFVNNMNDKIEDNKIKNNDDFKNKKNVEEIVEEEYNYENDKNIDNKNKLIQTKKNN